MGFAGFPWLTACCHATSHHIPSGAPPFRAFPSRDSGRHVTVPPCPHAVSSHQGGPRLRGLVPSRSPLHSHALPRGAARCSPGLPYLGTHRSRIPPEREAGRVDEGDGRANRSPHDPRRTVCPSIHRDRRPFASSARASPCRSCDAAANCDPLARQTPPKRHPLRERTASTSPCFHVAEMPDRTGGDLGGPNPATGRPPLESAASPKRDCGAPGASGRTVVRRPKPATRRRPSRVVS